MPDAPTIPRFWWLTRLAILLVAVVVGVVGFHLWLTRHAEARQAAMIDGWRGDGRPHPDDLERNTGTPPDVPGNAAVSLKKAITTLPPLTPGQNALDLHNGHTFPLPAQFEADVAELEASHATQFALIRDARAMPRLDWGIYAADFNASFGRTLNVKRETAVRLGWALALRHRRGDVAGAVEYGRDILNLGAAMRTDGPTLVTSLVSAGIHALAADRLRRMTLSRPLGLTVEEELAAWRDARPQVTAAIAELMDDGPTRDLGRLGFGGERVVSATLIDTLFAAPPGGGLGFDVNVVTAPVVRLDVQDAARTVDAFAAATGDDDALPDQHDALAAAGTPREPPPASSVAGAASGLLSSILLPSLDRAFVSFARVKADRRAAAVMLAAKLYAADHEGELPPSLDALVPEYLPRVPLDPFARGGRPMRYDPDAPLPIVYSVGEDFEDDGGSVVPTDPRRRRTAKNGGVDSHQHEKEDIVYPLRPSPVPFVDEMNYLFDGGRALVGDSPLVPASLLIP